MAHKVLVVDDDQVLRESLKEALEYHHFMVETAINGKDALAKVFKDKFDLVVMDVNMPELDGISALSEIKRHDPSIIVLILTAYSNVSDAVKVVKEGAYNYLEKPISSDNLISLIKRALKARVLVETMAFSAPSLNSSGDGQFVGESNVMKKVFDMIARLSKVNTPVLIRGESGTGKELVAKAIHFNGPRKDAKFVTINCGAIPENLIESELFGHEKGAFTGADQRKIGKFQFADGGTLFLDEIGDISQAMQVKLLRVLQEKTFTPVGSNREITVDVRIVAASHRPFELMIKDGTFREDLFYRLNVLPVYLPPLRERTSDIPHLVKHYINYFNEVHALHVTGIDDDVNECLVNYNWPGNIRELRNVIEHCFIMESDKTIHISSLPDALKKHGPVENFNDDSDSDIIDFEAIQNSVLDNDEIIQASTELSVDQGKLDFQLAKDQFEKDFIVMALRSNKGKINQTALSANIPKKTLLRKIEKYGINPREFY